MIDFSNWKGKIIGGLLGFMFGGPVGLIIGLVLGHLFDQGVFQKFFSSMGFSPESHSSGQEVFFNSAFTIMGYIAKSDGRVSENEIRHAQRVMRQMGLSHTMIQEAIRLFNIGKQPDFDHHAAISQLKKTCWNHPSLLRTFLEIQIQMAYADGHLSPGKRAALENVCKEFGIFGFNFERFEQQFRAGQNYQQYGRTSYRDPKQHLNDAYQVLGVASDAQDSEVKKAYRRLMSKHHPDKLIAQGLPPEMIKVATQKTQQIKKAYETIKQARRI